jgi:hypothetical protein
MAAPSLFGNGMAIEYRKDPTGIRIIMIAENTDKIAKCSGRYILVIIGTVRILATFAIPAPVASFDIFLNTF